MKPFTQLHVAQDSILREKDTSTTQEGSVPDPSSRPVESLFQETPAIEDTSNTIPPILAPEIRLTEKTGEVPSGGHQEPKIHSQYRNNRGSLTTLPPRICRRPANLNFLVPFGFLFMFSLLGPSTSVILLRDTVIFQEQPGIAMSESSSKLVMDWTPNKELHTINSVGSLIAQLSDAAKRHRADAISLHKKNVRTSFRDTSSYMAADKIDTKVYFFSTLLNMTKTRLTTCTMALSGGKTKRGILDMGGSALKWLFGVSTQSDLIDLHTEMGKRGLQQQHIVHLLDKQATIVNQTQPIAHSSLLLIKESEKRLTLFQKAKLITF
jgi:hypothetical protein